jgi:hypothetical protein
MLGTSTHRIAAGYFFLRPLLYYFHSQFLLAEFILAEFSENKEIKNSDK